MVRQPRQRTFRRASSRVQLYVRQSDYSQSNTADLLVISRMLRESGNRSSYFDKIFIEWLAPFQSKSRGDLTTAAG